MNKYIYIIVFFISYSINANTLKDSLKLANIEAKLEIINNQLKEVRRDELNYQLEKNLLKETYSNNYENINQVITIVLGIIGVLGYIGLRDINSIKKEYSIELDKLTKLKSELEFKTNSISKTQIKYEKEIKEIIEQNEEQNKKIKILELQQEIKKLKNEKKFPAALEKCNEALSIDDRNKSILNLKGLIYSKTKSYNEAVNTYKKILEIDSKNQDAILNLSEVYIFLNEISKFQELVANNREIFQEEDEYHLLSKVLIAFNKNDKVKIITEIQKQLNNLIKFKRWGTAEARVYVQASDLYNSKYIMLSYLDFIEGYIEKDILKEKLKEE